MKYNDNRQAFSILNFLSKCQRCNKTSRECLSMILKTETVYFVNIPTYLTLSYLLSQALD